MIVVYPDRAAVTAQDISRAFLMPYKKKTFAVAFREKKPLRVEVIS